MNVAIDAGNTLIKVGIFNEEGLLTDVISFPSIPVQNIYAHFRSLYFDRCIVSTVIPIPSHALNYLKLKSKGFIILDKYVKLPIINKYKTPDTLGKDRLALAVAAASKYPGKDVLNISVGTCITYNFVAANGSFTGGAISPGLHMRLRAMHEFTAGLPLVNLDESAPAILGNDTKGGMVSGIINGTIFEMEGYINKVRNKHKNCAVIISGGDSRYVAGKLNIETDIEPDLALTGLNIILNFNASEKN